MDVTEFNNIFRAYSRKQGHAFSIIKKGQESPVKGQNLEFLPLIFPNLGHLECYTSPSPPKQHVVLEFFVENKAVHFSKRALCAGNACNKWIKKALKTIF